MAGPSIMVRILADLSGLQKSVSDTETKGQKAAKGIHDAFGGVLDTLNKTGVLGPFGDALAGVNDAIGTIAEHAKDIGPAMLGVGSALAGIGAGLQTLGSKDQAAHQQLQASVAATGKSYDDYADRVDAAIKHQEKFGDSADETQNALSTLTQATNDPAKALQLLGTATDLAAAKHESLTTAAGQLGKAYNGNTKILKEFGVKTDGATTSTGKAHDAVTALGNKLAGQASAQADTFTGKIDGLKAKFEDSASEIGQKYGPAITGIGTAMAGVGGAITATQGILKAFSGAQKDVQAATEGVAAAQDAEAAASWLSLGPILLIIAAIAALVAIAYVLYRNWNTIWTGMKAVEVDVWNWIKANWPLLLGIITGPIGLAVVEIIKHWDDVKKGFQDAINAIKGAWNTFVGWLTGLAGSIARIAVGMWHGITDAFNSALGAVKGAWATFWGWFTGLPGAIARTASGMWDGILGAFRSMVNGIIDIWNQLHFTLPKIDAGPIHIGGETIGVPHIPHLAQGGLITGSGVVYAHAGEVISPAPAMTRSGPAVVFQGATFNQGVDVDTMMRRAAWIIRTQRI